MKLLIVTQNIDRTDPILGFFHRWVEEFASRCEHVTVIAQQVGTHTLPKNVSVLSLGKEKRTHRFLQILRFWKLITVHAKKYDAVFVHMTPIWMVLGGPLWILLRKRRFLWYEIKRGSWKLSVALRLVCTVFAASEHGLPAVSRKQVIVGHGIDIEKFTINPSLREKGHLVSVGRITAIKHYELILRVLSELPGCTLTIAGGTVTEADKKTEHGLRELMHRLQVADRVEMGWMQPEDVPKLLQRADCMLHASQGGLDKVVLQAMACGCPVVSTSDAAKTVLPSECQTTPEDMAEKVQVLLDQSPGEREALAKKLRATVEQDHSLSQCISRIVSHM